MTEARSERSLLIALLLNIFLPGIGAHRLYAGKFVTGFLQLALLVVSGILLLMGFASVSAILAGDFSTAQDAAGSLGVAVLLLGTWALWIFVDLVLLTMRKFRDEDGLLIKY